MIRLALDFTTASLDSRITFTRTTGASNPATYVNSSGVITAATSNQPRFDYNPIALTCKGLLIEGSRTNLLTYSSDLSNAAWTKSSVNTTGTPPYVDVQTSPDGTVSADKFIPTASAAAANFARSFSVTSGSTYTFSFFAKAAEQTKLSLVSNIVSAYRVSVFNLTTKTVQSTASGWSASVTPLANDWVRCVCTFTATSTASVAFQISNNSAGWTGDGTSGIYIWGAQLEAGASATSYIPTTTTALTRNADVATITGTNFSDFWQSVKGGASVLATPSTASGICPLVQFDDNTANEIIALRGNTINPELYIVDGGTPQAQLDAGTIAANTAYSLTGWWDTNDCKARQNSGAVVIDTTATIPTVTQMRIGSDGTNYLNGTIATVNYYDSFLGQPIYTRRKNKVFPSLL